MLGHYTDGKYNTDIRLLPPVTKARGITMDQKKAEDFELERMYYRESKLRRKTQYKTKTFDNFFKFKR